jgi:hypothetical protein
MCHDGPWGHRPFNLQTNELLDPRAAELRAVSLGPGGTQRACPRQGLDSAGSRSAAQLQHRRQGAGWLAMPCGERDEAPRLPKGFKPETE